MGWAMLASVLAPYLISAFKGGSGDAGGAQPDPQALADTNQMRTELLRSIQQQNQRFDARSGLDAQVVSLMKHLMPSTSSGLITPGDGTDVLINPNYPRQVPPNASTGRVYPNGGTGTPAPGTSTPAPSTNGDGSSQGTRIVLGDGANQGSREPFTFPGWIDTLPTYKSAAKARMR